MADKPAVVVFDVNETLLDLTTLEPLFARLFGEGRLMRDWFAHLILYSQTATLSGLYAPFGDLAVGALRMTGEIEGVAVTDADVAELREKLGTMPAHPDAVPALEHLRDAGFRLVTLTNSAPSPSPTPLERAGLSGYFERSFSVDAVRRFKPAPETYRQVADGLGVDARDLCLVSCHVWDTIGAQAAGCLGAFVARPRNTVLRVEGMPRPDFEAPDLVALARAISDGASS